MGVGSTEQAVTGLPLTTALTLAARTMAARVDRIVSAAGFSFDQWLVLDALARTDGLSMAELAAGTHVTGPTLTRVVDRLATTAAIYREADPADRRRVLVHLAPRGRKAHQRFREEIDAAERELLGGVEAPEQVTALLHRLAGRQ